MRAHYAIYRSLNAAHKVDAGLPRPRIIGFLEGGEGNWELGLGNPWNGSDPHASWTEVLIWPCWGSALPTPLIVVPGLSLQSINWNYYFARHSDFGWH